MTHHTRYIGMTLLSAAAALALVSSGASAQSKVDQYVAHGAQAKDALDRDTLLGDVAQKLSNVCEAYAKQHNVSVTIFILDRLGNIIHAHRQEGNTKTAIDTALMKARTALNTRDATHNRANQIGQDPFRRLQMMQLDQFPVKGGLPIIVDDQLLGSIGVGGSNVDEECAYEALTQVFGPQPPLAVDAPRGGAGGGAAAGGGGRGAGGRGAGGG